MSDYQRSILRSAGYKVDRRGPLTKRSRSAWEDYQSGKPQPKLWNTRNPNKSQRRNLAGPAMRGRHDRDSSGMDSPAFKREMAKVDAESRAFKRKRAAAQARRSAAAAARRNRNRGGGQGAGPVGGAPVDDFAEPESFDGVPEFDERGHRTARMLPRSMADTLAGYQFDPQIHELLAQVERGRRDERQHQGDIGGWYGQVRGSQETARQRDVEAGTRARGDLQGALDSVLRSLGGSRGAGVVGAAGLNDLTALAAQGASQDRYNADLQPLLAAEEAGAHSRETALASQRRSALDQALVGARGQRGQARSKALLEIIAANNQGRQTNFQNRLAIQNARMAGASLGLSADQAYAGIEAQRAATKQNAQKLKLQTLAFQQEKGAPNWARLNYPDRQTVVHDAVGRAAATMAPDHWDDAYVRDRALRIIRAGGYKSARGRNYRGKVNRQSQRQIQDAVDAAARAAYQAWKAKQG